MTHLLLIIATSVPSSVLTAQLRITVYDEAHLKKEVSQTAFDDVRQIFHASGIETLFVAGDPASSEAALITLPEVPRKGREEEASCGARRDIALDITAAAPSTRKDTILGMAQPLARRGLNARVFDDRILDAAMMWNRSHAAVLAHAIAHEIGHVLLRTTAHTSRGLMAEVWRDYEYERLARDLMFFTEDQAQRMRMTLNGTGCSLSGVAAGRLALSPHSAVKSISRWGNAAKSGDDRK